MVTGAISKLTKPPAATLEKIFFFNSERRWKEKSILRNFGCLFLMAAYTVYLYSLQVAGSSVFLEFDPDYISPIQSSLREHCEEGNSQNKNHFQRREIPQCQENPFAHLVKVIQKDSIDTTLGGWGAAWYNDNLAVYCFVHTMKRKKVGVKNCGKEEFDVKSELLLAQNAPAYWRLDMTTRRRRRRKRRRIEGLAPKAAAGRGKEGGSRNRTDAFFLPFLRLPIPPFFVAMGVRTANRVAKHR